MNAPSTFNSVLSKRLTGGVLARRLMSSSAHLRARWCAFPLPVSFLPCLSPFSQRRAPGYLPTLDDCSGVAPPDLGRFLQGQWDQQDYSILPGLSPQKSSLSKHVRKVLGFCSLFSSWLLKSPAFSFATRCLPYYLKHFSRMHIFSLVQSHTQTERGRLFLMRVLYLDTVLTIPCNRLWVAQPSKTDPKGKHKLSFSDGRDDSLTGKCIYFIRLNHTKVSLCSELVLYFLFCLILYFDVFSLSLS